MPVTIGNVLDEAAQAATKELLSKQVWADGTRTAGAVARAVKKNLQADLSTRTGARLRELMKAALTSNSVIQAAARPAKWSKLIVSLWGPYRQRLHGWRGTTRAD